MIFFLPARSAFQSMSEFSNSLSVIRVTAGLAFWRVARLFPDHLSLVATRKR